jgi:tRNA (guanine37-N1)-methyltransferase
MIRFDILTLFPGFFLGPLSESILKRAIDKGLIDVQIFNIRDYTTDKHRVTDDYPYGGGGGMVMKPEPIAAAIKERKKEKPEAYIVFMTPQGRPFTQDMAKSLSEKERIVFLCGRYEAVDERIRKNYIDTEISIGDYVLTGGEAPALVVIDAVSRMIPGVLGNELSYRNDSFYAGLLDHPHYTRPEVFEDESVPEVLLSGHHRNIVEWRRKQCLLKTLRIRPDLLEGISLSEKDRAWLEELDKFEEE